MTSLSTRKLLFNRTDLLILAFVSMAVVVIYYPVYYTRYLYTDEATQLWFSGTGVHRTWLEQGRFISYLLFTGLFGSVHSIHDVVYLRLFSLAGWVVCLPVWYYIIKDLLAKNKLPAVLAPLAIVYLVCMPPFSISIGWASCAELFIACTAGLVSGYLLYNNLYKQNGRKLSTVAIVLGLLAGIVALCTYQNGFGCFFIPFFIDYIASRKMHSKIRAGIGAALLIYTLYWLLFRYSLYIMDMPASNRSSFAVNPFHKVLFLLGRPLSAAFHFTWLFNERSMGGIVCYALVATGWLLGNFKRLQEKKLVQKLLYFAGLLVFFGLVYLPSLLVAENYASNRTLLALNMIVLLLVAETIFAVIKKQPNQLITAAVLILFFVVNGWYNFNRQFVKPLEDEYSSISKIVTASYTERIHTIWFIQPAEDAFVKQYGIVASWDEFGVPSTAKKWTPEPLIKQLVFEKTGNRKTAEQLIVKSWESYDAFSQSGEKLTVGILFIDAAELIKRSR